MINLDSITNENNKRHNEKWPFQIPWMMFMRILIITTQIEIKSLNCF